MARPAKVTAATTAETIVERKTKVYTIPKGGGILFRIKSDAIIYDKLQVVIARSDTVLTNLLCLQMSKAIVLYALTFCLKTES
jgi:hypothetical protein